ncbi:preprotein translocase, YajC subunit [Corynebacterium mustelae]|uniref:Preprotein translocase, YajC subunit n=1 Tax=Corynebacterium mustelae TaxID=571915 RepID=A0A0G3GY40_9CORY|nr:preprotein translocase subunit YajC [Corynebacterium mustelae]AKK06074.1 preprotein translocase, YajC subunit [Corynebacterium mustelae]
MFDSVFLLIVVLALVALPSFIIQRKQRRHLDKIREIQDSVVIGDTIVTTAGLHAVVRGISETTVELETASGVVSTWEKYAILRNITQEPVSDIATP